MLHASSISQATTAIAWNGPTCQTCGARYLDSHACSHEDIVRRINELLALLGSLGASDVKVRVVPTGIRPGDLSQMSIEAMESRG